MAKEITIDKLEVANKLTSKEVHSTDIFVDEISVKEVLKKLPPSWVKSVNGNTADASGNISVDVGVKTVNGNQPDENGNVEVQGGGSSEYTAYEVFPTNIEIPAGTYDCNFYELEDFPEKTKENYEKYLNSVIKVGDKKYYLKSAGGSYSFQETTDYTVAELFGHNFDVVTGLSYTVAVPAADTAGFTTKTYVDQADNDIVIDWGDGTKSVVKELTAETGLVGYEDVETEDIHDDRKVQVKHKYAADKVNQRYIVKIYGTHYTTLRTFCSGVTNICSRIFEWDLPISSTILALSSVCQKHNRLLRLNATEYFNFKNVNNFKYAFFADGGEQVTPVNTSNLKVINFADRSSFYTLKLLFWGCAFSGCRSLVKSNLRVPGSCEDFNDDSGDFYSHCDLLESNVNDLLPINGFDGRKAQASGLFYMCPKLTGSVSNSADILWGDTTKIWRKSGCFHGCTSLTDYASIPADWKSYN